MERRRTPVATASFDLPTVGTCTFGGRPLLLETGVAAVRLLLFARWPEESDRFPSLLLPSLLLLLLSLPSPSEAEEPLSPDESSTVDASSEHELSLWAVDVAAGAPFFFWLRDVLSRFRTLTLA